MPPSTPVKSLSISADDATIQNLKTTIQSPLKTLHAQYGQSIWLDYIQRCMIRNGELRRLIEEDGIRGVTSNPALFQQAITDTTDYDLTFTTLAANPGNEVLDLYEELAIADIQAAADILTPLYNQSKHQDGYVSLEVSPYLADDAEQTLEEARRLWSEVNRPNLMVIVPATAAGIPVIQQLISEGINVNVTLLFSQEAYVQVADAYLTGLETFAQAGGDVSRVASVASFFISRIDTAVDTLIAQKLTTVTDDSNTAALLESLKGKVAIANAKLVYKEYVTSCLSERWQSLAKLGAQPQRLLWASTDTKNPQYSDVRYVEELIGPDTVNTTPFGTLSAFLDHGKARASLAEEGESAALVIDRLAEVSIDFQTIADQLLVQGVHVFHQVFDQLLQAIEEKAEAQQYVP